MKLPHLYRESASALTGPYDWSGTVYINPTANLTLTLATPKLGQRLDIVHVGTANTITVNDDAGNTIATLTPAQMATSVALAGLTSGRLVAEWPTGLVVASFAGNVYLQGDLVIRNSAKGLVLIDTTDAHAVRTVATADLLVPSDIGSAPA